MSTIAIVQDYSPSLSMTENIVDTERERALLGLGLTKNETRVYLSLLELGSTTVTKVASGSKVHRVNVYDSLEKLRKRGLVSQISQGDKKQYQATSPDNLFNILREKEIHLKGILPQLQLNHQLSTDKCNVEIHEGIGAVRSLFLNYLKIGEDILDFGVPKTAIGLLGEFFQNSIHQKRIKQKQHMYHIYNADATDRMKYLNKLPYTEARYLSAELNGPVATRICGDEISITHYSDKTTTIVIKNPIMAEAYRNYFWVLWKLAKE
jgi:predicted DNA-binding transcriptional regulator